MSAPLKFELDRRQGVLNIGYGAGSSPSFTNLTVTGIITAPNLTSPAGNNLTLAAGGTNQSVILTPSGTGGVGIGTTTPTGLLNVYSNAASAYPTIRVESGASAEFPVFQLTDGRVGGAPTWQIENGRTLGVFGIFGGTSSGTKLSINMAGTVSIASSTAGSAGAGALVVTGGLATGAASYFGGAVTSSTTLGVGGANAPWYNTGAISVGGWLDLGNGDGGASTRILSNAYAAGSGDWRSRQGAFGSLAIQLEPNLQQIIFYTAPAVSQNAALTFTSRVAISTTGLAVTGALSTTGAATFAGAVNVAGVLYGAGTNTWALQSVGASGALVAGGWLYGINNGFNITPNGAGVAGATFMLAAFDGTGYREMLSTANVASGASTLRLAGYGGPTTVGGTLGVAGAATFGGAVEITGATTLNNDVYQTALKKFYVDSGSNTYFHENSSDSFQIVTGGTVASTLTAGSVLFNGTVIAPAATASLAPLRIPHGTVAPTSPTDGDMWTTTAGLFIRINGVTKTVTLT